MAGLKKAAMDPRLVFEHCIFELCALPRGLINQHFASAFAPLAFAYCCEQEGLAHGIREGTAPQKDADLATRIGRKELYSSATKIDCMSYLEVLRPD